MESLEKGLLAALEASQHGKSDNALQLFGELATDYPESFEVRFLYAAELAAAGYFDQALLSYDQAIRLQPEHAICRFQYGLLLLTLGHDNRSVSILEPLLDLPEAHYINQFARALLAIARGLPLEAEQPLRKGLASNAELPDLSHDMALILRRVLEYSNRPQTDRPINKRHSMLESAAELPTEYLVKAYSKRLN
ncbi:hypothetical protein ACTSKR_08425 [Chitinibacteraceae bacterium HSL-7]